MFKFIEKTNPAIYDKKFNLKLRLRVVHALIHRQEYCSSTG